MFHISVLVLILANQAIFVTGDECSKDACKKCTITRTVNPNSLIWNKDGTTILSSTYQATNTCLPSAPNTKYATYCFEDPPKYIFILELLNPKEHAGSTFSDGSSGQTTTINLMVPNNLSSDNLTLNIPDKISGDIVNVSVSVPCSKPQPTFTWNFKASKSTINYTIGSTQTSTDNTGCTPSLLKRESLLSFNLNVWDPDITKLDGDIDISVDVKFDKCDKISSSPVTVKYIAPGSPSSPPTPSTSTSLESTSSAPNPSTKVSSESSTSTTPIPSPKCEYLICVCDQICIIISACVGSLIIIVVIILCCCCCPFCPCYKRKKKKCEGTECKCCGLICVCCRPNNEDHDQESEERVKVCESCCCLFCVCYKRKKKSSDRNSNPNKTKSSSRSKQYEMRRTNHPDEMHSYSGHQVNRPDERARDYQPAGSHYHVSRPDQRTFVYQPAPATGFTLNESRYGQGYNNAAYVYHDENERRRNMDRKSRVTQRPYTKHY